MVKAPDRLVIVRNPNSTRASHVDKDVISPLVRENIPFTVFETQHSETEANILDMRNAFRDGDQIVVAAGDGTKSQAMNAVLRDELSDVRFGLLPYGNYNDLGEKGSDILKIIEHRDEIRQIHPLTVEVNGEYWRHAPAYMTLGFTARIAEQFDDGPARDHLKKLPPHLRKFGNLAMLGVDYFKLREEKLPAFHTSESPVVRHAVTDILLLNSRRAGGIIRSTHDYATSDMFGFKEADVSTILKNIPYGVGSLMGDAKPDGIAATLTINFEGPSTVPVQTEGEYSQLTDVSTIHVHKKPSESLNIIRTK